MPSKSRAEWPGVSYVMPVLNEALYLRAAIETITAQEYPGRWELVLALGPSDDSTLEIAKEIAAADDRIRYVMNPETDIPIGLNLAVQESRFEIIVRVDAHSELSPGYTVRAVEALERSGAANVGGLMHAAGNSPFQASVARAYNSRFGLGGGAYHAGGPEGPSESAYLGVFRRAVITEVGGYDETLRRGEDWELNLRIRRAGHTVWFDPSLTVTYWPRASWSDLSQQFRSTGVWRGELVRRYGAGNSVRFFAPPVLVIALILALVLGITTAGIALLSVAPLALVWAAGLSALAPIAYLGFLGFAFLRDSGSIRSRAQFVTVIATMHISWGLGFLRGLLFGAGNNRDRSRIAPRPRTRH
ncbi:glycosyltransferase family 2 protein [Humidisolicoccus flavus]|uniref:glycosyltransferase family 2 protein n=1 Tax=Humidisolicoccus flavus TaxID=3111414 RepID=UPI003244AA6C